MVAAPKIRRDERKELSREGSCRKEIRQGRGCSQNDNHKNESKTWSAPLFSFSDESKTWLVPLFSFSDRISILQFLHPVKFLYNFIFNQLPYFSTFSIWSLIQEKDSNWPTIGLQALSILQLCLNKLGQKSFLR